MVSLFHPICVSPTCWSLLLGDPLFLSLAPPEAESYSCQCFLTPHKAISRAELIQACGGQTTLSGGYASRSPTRQWWWPHPVGRVPGRLRAQRRGVGCTLLRVQGLWAATRGAVPGLGCDKTAQLGKKPSPGGVRGKERRLCLQYALFPLSS